MGAPDLLQHLRGAGLVLTLTQDGGLHVAPRAALTDDLRAAIRASKPDLLALLAAEHEAFDERPYRLTLEQLHPSHADAMDEAATVRFRARAAHCRRLGFTADEAEDLAEQLHLRDLHADFRHLCVECQHYRPGRCGNHAAAGLATNIVGRELATMFQHCNGFKEISHGIT